MPNEHLDLHKPYAGTKPSYHHTYVPEPWTMVHLGAPGKVPAPKEELRFGYPGITLYTTQNIVARADERILFHAKNNATFRSAHSISLLAHDHVNSLSNRATNVGSAGAVVLASISSVPDVVEPRAFEKTGQRAPVEAEHPTFVTARNKFFNSIVSASNQAKAINSIVSLGKTVLGFQNGIGDTSLAAFNTVVGTFNSLLGTTAALFGAANDKGSTTESIDAAADPATTTTSSSSSGTGGTSGSTSASSGTGTSSGSTSSSSTTAKKNVDEHAGKGSEKSDPSKWQSTVEGYIKNTATVGKDLLSLGGTLTKDHSAWELPKLPDGADPAAHQEQHSQKKASFEKSVDRFTGTASNVLSTSTTMMGVAGAITDLNDAVGAKPKPLGGLVALSDTSMMFGAEKDITMVAKGGVNVVVPAVFSGVSVLSGGGIGVTTALSSSVFSLQGLSLEGGLTAGLSAAGPVSIGSRRKEVAVMGRAVKIGARAKTVDQMSRATRTGSRSLLDFNPQKQLATQSVAVETDVGGVISLVVPTEKTQAGAFDALGKDIKENKELAKGIIAVGLPTAGAVAGIAAAGSAGAGLVGAALGAGIAIADALARMNEKADDTAAEPEKQTLKLSKDDLVLRHNDARITLKKDTGVTLEYLSGDSALASIVIDKDGNITLKGKKLLLDFEDEVKAQAPASSWLKVSSSGVETSASQISLNSSNLQVVK